MPLLDIRDLVVQYRDAHGTITAVDEVSLSIERGVIHGLLGESGCGKSTLAEAIVRILPENAALPSGSIQLDGVDMETLSEDALRAMRWEDVAFIPQNAMACLDPVKTIRTQMVDIVQNHRDASTSEAVERAAEVLEAVGIDASRLGDYPHQLSGGMKQRVILAMSLLLEPKLIIADEPTTGVDVITRDRILNDIERYRDEYDISVLIISHDIADMIETCDALSVMYGGKIVETGPTEDLFERPHHPYTIGLKHSLPSIQTDPDQLVEMKMDPPNMRDPPEACRFAHRCPFAIEECVTVHPPLEAFGRTQVACYRADESEQLRAAATDASWTDVPVQRIHQP